MKVKPIGFVPVGLLFDIVDRMQLPAAEVFPLARAGEAWIRPRVSGAVSRKIRGWYEITEMLRVPRRCIVQTVWCFGSSAKGHLVDALALRGEEGRSTLR